MTYRVAIIEFINECNTFTVMRTGMSDFHASHYFVGDEIPANFRGTGSEVGGAIEVADAKGWTPVYITAAHAEPGGIITEAARREITNECLRRLTEGGPYDGIFVALHGAMVTETDQDGDCQFLREIRAVVGGEVPLAITLDLHANIFDELADLANIAVSFRTYPHIDGYDRAVQAATLVQVHRQHPVAADRAAEGAFCEPSELIRGAVTAGVQIGQHLGRKVVPVMLHRHRRHLCQCPVLPGISSLQGHPGLLRHQPRYRVQAERLDQG